VYLAGLDVEIEPFEDFASFDFDVQIFDFK
jgi:hypothetical protein